MAEEKKTPVFKCKYNSGGVECPSKSRDCAVCGWNPYVKAARVKRLRRVMKSRMAGAV